mmetsp:Transcript_61649/g.199677  ORF Transcript_61649/g.199677 Transcript_61649/m.199677 type:complete len:366 (+) Transcript_61649:263-1360(+)
MSGCCRRERIAFGQTAAFFAGPSFCTDSSGEVPRQSRFCGSRGSSIVRVIGRCESPRAGFVAAAGCPSGGQVEVHRHHFCVVVLNCGVVVLRGGGVVLRLVASRRLRIGIVGFGTFGRFLAKTFVKHHDVVVTSRSPYSAEAADLGVSYWPMSEVDKFFEERLDVCVLAVSIVSFESIIELLAPHMAGRELLVVDVLSVKAYPRELLLRHVPADCDLLSTHPMFGPDSGGGPTGWAGLNFVYEPVRVTEHPARRDLLEHFLSIWEREGCQMVQMTCDEHDQYAANSQFVTHMVGRILGDQRLTPTPIDTKGFQSLLRVVDNTNSDSFALFYGLYRYNNNSRATINALRCSLDRIVVSLEQASADQ